MDPTGISPIVIQKLMELGTSELKAIYKCKDKGKALGDYLDTVRPLLDEATKTPLAGHDSVKTCLKHLDEVLNKSQLEVSKCEEVRFWSFWRKRRLSRMISKLSTDIEDILGKQVPLVLVDLGVRNNSKVDKMDQQLDRMEMKLDMRAQAQGILDNLRKLPNKVFGTGANLETLENLLLAESQNEWVGVCGRGGIGKTLLAEQTFNSAKVREHFQNQSWVTVGQNPSIQQLQKNLAGQMEVDIENMERADVRAKLCNALKGKKVLLLLDDIWDDGIPVLDSLDVTSEGTGSKILVTTRHIKVLKKRKARHECIVGIESLTDGDSFELFCEHAFGGVDNIPDQLDQTVIKSVVGECKGPSLALKVIARALAGETLPKTWQRQLRNLQEARLVDKDQEPQLYDTLRLSYDSLQPRQQKCFIYFAAFPEDYDVDSKMLANLWAGEKLLQAGGDGNDDFDPSEESFCLLIELIDRSLIDLRWSDKKNPCHIRCRVHDVLRDFARYLISQKEAPMDCLFRAGETLSEVSSDWLCGPPRDVTHLSLYDNPMISLPSDLNAPKLEVLLLGKDCILEYGGPLDYGPTLSISPEFFESFSSLKVLDLKGRNVESLPESVGSLKNLIYLELSYTGLRKLPERLQELIKLENLSLQHCIDVEPWPFDISCLKSLSTLLTDECQHIWDPVPERWFPGRKSCDSLDSLYEITGLRNLSMYSTFHYQIPSQLRTLSRIVNLALNCSELISLPNLHELQQLTILNLSGCASLSQIPDGFTKEGAFPNLQEFNLNWCSSLEYIPPIEEEAFPKLTRLSMKGCAMLDQLPAGFTRRVFPSLETLSFDACSGLQKFHPSEEGAFPKLENLSMRGCTMLVQLPSGFTKSGAFPTLKVLDFSNCLGLEEFPPIEEGAFPKLEYLSIMGCVSLVQLPNTFTKKGSFPNLKILDVEGCSRLQEIPSIEEGAYPKLEYLSIRRCVSLLQLPSEFAKKEIFPALETLDLQDCSGLQEIPSIEEEAFPKLKNLFM